MEVDQVHEMVEDTFRLERIENGILTEAKRMLTDLNSTPVPKNMELRFSKKISQPTLACHEIKGEGNTCIEVVLIDSSTGKKVEVGPVAFATIEFVALAQGTDDCTGEGFNEKIVTVEGKKPLLTVNMCQLQGGSCVLEDVKFRHHATQVKPTVFRLGARIVGTFDGTIVKEAKTESFVVKCYRNKYFMKNEVPNLTDKIWVLRNIQRRGKIDERLQAEGIDTVEKFLIYLLINHQELKNIARSTGKKWEGTINHARKCQSDKLYWYFNSQENLGVVFNIFGKLQVLYSEGEYAATDVLSEDKKVDADKLLSSAFEHWKDVVSFDDPTSLQQHLDEVKTSFHHLSNSRIPGHPGIIPNSEASEMVDESIDKEVLDPLSIHGISILDTNPLARCDSFDICDVEVEDLYDSSWVLDYYSNIDHGTQQQDFIGGVVADARADGTGIVLAESEVVVPCSTSPRKWATLVFCLSKWFLFSNMLKSGANRGRKKQKTC